ncbi:MAG: DEAD/DEAH box helicase [Verrucomicrobia bacterium]|nr:DEAD/DEAH box helicase [Verrucomicrobiota bacterium]
MSFPDAAILTTYPILLQWLKAAPWRDDFDQAIQDRSHGIPVASIKLKEDLDEVGNSDAILLDARVIGSRPKPYRTQLCLYFDDTFDEESGVPDFDLIAECTCHVGYDCKHAVAVLEKLHTIATAPTSPHQPHLNAELAAWLRKMKDVGTAAAVPPTPATPYNKFLAYCIEQATAHHPPTSAKLRFALHVGNRHKTGVSIEPGTATADPSRPTRYMVPEDLPICALYHQKTRKNHHWGGAILLEGDEWEDILMPALATGRLFFGQETGHYRSSYQYRPLTDGPSLPVEASWKLLPDGSACPILKLPSPTLLVVPTTPLRYLDPETHTLGHLHSHLPAAILQTWAAGPAVPPASITTLGRELAAIFPENPLPLPVEQASETLTGLTPVPCLRITEILVGIFLKRHIGGVLTFRYPDCPPLLPLAPHAAPRSSWFDGDKRMILEREPHAENAFAKVLTCHGLSPLHEHFPDCELTAKNRHALILGTPNARAADWLEFMATPEFRTLEAQGWIIETDPKLGLTIHDIQDFFPAIESDPDHGIDWFRFDVTGEFNGKRVSLIPQIAQAIAQDWHARYPDPAQIPATILLPCDKLADGHVRFPARRFLDLVEQVRHLFHGIPHGGGPLRLDRLGAAGLADSLAIDGSETARSLAALGRNLRDIQGLPPAAVPATIRAELRPYQHEGFRWLQFLAHHGLHGILADDMGLGKTLQTLTHLAAEHAKAPGQPSLVIAPTSVVPNWADEVEKFAPHLKILTLHGINRFDNFAQIPAADLVITSYPLLVRDFKELSQHHWHVLVLDEAQYIKNPKAQAAHSACKLKAAHRLCLSGTPMQNHLGELWSLMRFLMPGFLSDEKSFNTHIRKPIERDRSSAAQAALNRRVSPLLLRRTKDQVATELPAKTTLIHGIDLTPKQTDLYESVRAAMDQRVQDAIAAKGLAKSHIIVLDALLKLRQICCHPQLLKSAAAQKVTESAKLHYLTSELLPTLLEEGRRILLFSQFTSMLALIEEHLTAENISFLKLTGQTTERASLVKKFQSGEVPIFLISLKAGGTGLNLTAADTVIHYDPWWNPAAENQATDRAHRIGQTKPVFVHKLVCRGTIEDRILDLQKHKSALVEALLSEDTAKLSIDPETLSHLLAPLA